jgi:A/G-specific adenine glycosylase
LPGMDEFASALLTWYQHHGRRDLPWQRQRNAYRVWISEIMLQQTQVKTVVPYFERFMARYPDVGALAAAKLDDVLQLWSGLGYYARARNLHRAAQKVASEFGGEMPDDPVQLQSLPGIGRSTAGAILALSANRPFSILDGNAKRVLTRYHGIDGWPGRKTVENRLWELAEAHTPAGRAADYTQAIMDLGATVCTRSRPVCERCPVTANCVARRQNRQQSLPEKKSRKPLPVKATLFTIIENNRGEILLQKRPPAGIWGGLWCLPECPVDTDVTTWVEERFGGVIESLEAADPFRHTFSHFHLDITPVRVKTRTESVSISDQADTRWIKPGQAAQIGMAAPVRKLIESINHNGRHVE